ncbi:MAG: hypothetical protein J0I41_20995 [Filimonas sp.]|nr:hypothetical protein [Filimonas sp.]
MKKINLLIYCISVLLATPATAQSFLDGVWEGTEKRTAEWGTSVFYTRPQPLKIEVKIDTAPRRITVNRLFNIQWNGDKVGMTASMIGYFRGRYYAMQEEHITSRQFVFRFPGLYSDMPHYLFEDGYLWYYIDGNEIVLYASMEMYERNYYDNNWARPHADWHSAHFKKQEDPATASHNYDSYYGGYTKPVIIPGGFFYKAPGEFNSPTFNRSMATYFWTLRKKLPADQLKEATDLFVQSGSTELTIPLKKDTVAIQKNIINEVVQVSNKKIEVAVFDNAIEDGDIITLLLNGEQVASKLKVTKEKKMIRLSLKQGENLLTMLAENEGSIPPNTAAFTFSDAGNTQTVILNSTKGNTQSVRILVK